MNTPLHDIHVSFGGRMVDFAGWSMPLMFAGIIEEHVHTRTACSLFDVSHMARLRVTGADAEVFLDRLCTRNLAGADVGRCYYSHICREDGGVLDDVIVSRFESHWGIVANATNREKIFNWISQHARDVNVKLTDDTLSTVMVALQGPKTVELAEELAGLDLSALKRYRFMVHELMGVPITIYRSGYTGEDGLEVVAPAGLGELLAPRLLGMPDRPHPGIKPAGLGARDTLRIEAAMPLYGNELTEKVDSLTAGQGWCVDLTGDFIGAKALRELSEGGLSRRLVGLELDGRRIARQHHNVFCGDRQVGEVTSGTVSPTLGKSIAMAFVASDFVAEGTMAEIDLGGKRVGARVVKLPFYKRPKK
jgi:aminomethyltransferase